MNDELNLGTMTLESSPKNMSKAHNFYRINESGITNEGGSGALIMQEGTLFHQASLQSIDQYAYTDDNVKLKPNTGLRIQKV